MLKQSGIRCSGSHNWSFRLVISSKGMIDILASFKTLKIKGTVTRDLNLTKYDTRPHS